MGSRRLLLVCWFAIFSQVSFAAEKEKSALDWGFTIWDSGYSETSNITGGLYLHTGVDLFLFDVTMVNISYDTNILAKAYQDKIVSADTSTRLFTFDPFGSSVGLGYLNNLTNLSSPGYFGVHISPFESGKSQFKNGIKLYLSMFPFSLYYNPTSKEYLWNLSFLDMKFFM